MNLFPKLRRSALFAQVLYLSALGGVPAIQAATYVQTFYNSSNTELWNNSTVWGGNAVTAGNSYSSAGGTSTLGTSYTVNGTTWSWKGAVRDTSGSAPASTTFLGDSLILNASTRLIMKGRNNTVSTANIVMNGGHIILAADSGGSGTTGTTTLAGTLDIAAPLAAIGVYGANGGQSTLNINSTITGTGTLQLTSYGSTRTGVLNITGDYSAFAGTFYVSTASDQAPNAIATGMFSFVAGIAPQATLNLNTASTNFSFNLNNNITFGSVIVGGTTLASGTYSWADLNALAPGKFVNNAGTITVVPEPTYVAGGMIAMLATAAMLRRRRLHC